MDSRLRSTRGPLLALLVIGVMEALARSGHLVVAPGVILLLPVMYSSATGSAASTLLTSICAILYQFRHFALDRNEYADPTRGLSADDLGRIVIFGVAVVGLFAIARFRENQRQIQNSLQNAYRSAVEANRAKSEFLTMVSHELRTPLTAIIQYTDLLAAGVGGALNPEQRGMLGQVESGALHLRGLIQRLLDYARLEAGRIVVRPEPVELDGLVRILAASFEPSARDRGIDLRVEVPEHPVVVETDASLLRQILLNLIDNAVKFTDEGAVTVRLSADETEVEIEVADTGIGIPEPLRARVFEAFWQQEDALTRRRGGLGLGLAIVRELAAQLGADVSVHPGRERGTHFRVRLPAPPS